MDGVFRELALIESLVPPCTLFGLANLQQKVHNLRQCVSSEHFQHLHKVHRLPFSRCGGL